MSEEQQSEDHYSLLVKAWEQKVFPIIRRRFRNEAERKDGLEQIRGALQLGDCLYIQGVPFTMLPFRTAGISFVLDLESRYFHITFHTPIGFMC